MVYGNSFGVPGLNTTYDYIVSVWKGERGSWMLTLLD